LIHTSSLTFPGCAFIVIEPFFEEPQNVYPSCVSNYPNFKNSSK
jgi:hypothetical protein